MASISKPTLELEDHRRFQMAFWRMQRIAWVGFALILMAALVGLTGAGGPLSRGSAQFAAGVIDHPRVARWNAAEEFRVRLGAGAAEREIVLSTAFADHFQIEDVRPAPVRSIAGARGDRLLFEVEPGQPLVVVVHVRAQRPGLVTYSVGLDGGAPRILHSTVLP